MNWQRYFGTVQYTRPHLAQQNPAFGLVESNLSGQWRLYSWDTFRSSLQQLSPAAAMPFYELSPDGRFVFYLQDAEGNAYGHVVSLPTAGGAVADLTPDLPPYNAYAIILSRGGERAGFTWSTPDGFHACVVDLDQHGRAAARREIYQTRSLLTCPWLSADGKLAVLATNQFSGEMAFGLLGLDVERGEVIATLWDGPGSEHHPMIHAPFSPVSGDPRILTRANHGGFHRPVIWNPCSGQRLDLLFEDQPGDILPKSWSPDGRQILLEQLDCAVQRLGIYELDSGATRWLDLPPGVYWDAQFGAAGQLIAQWEDLSHPPRIAAIAIASGERTPLLPETEADSEGSTWRSITFPSSDGQPVQAWLALPRGKGPFPTIIEAHGGPEDVRMSGYQPEALAWLEQGFAFATVNYRGSTTFGKAFHDQIQGDWGHWELEDLAACRAHLVQQGTADPDQVFLTGYSYGGYLTLLALGKQPELWRGGLAGGPVADWRLLYEDTPESGRQMALAFFGGSPEEQPDRYRDCSPATYVEQVRAPVFIWMGRQDLHVSLRQVEAYIAALQALGKTVQAAWYTGGHAGPVDSMNETIDIQARQMEFVKRVITR